MSFTALLLPLRPHLTYYRYLAGGGGICPVFPPSGSSWGNPMQVRSQQEDPGQAGRAGSPGFTQPSPLARGCTLLRTNPSNYSWIYSHP